LREPSPDALSAYGASVSAGVEKEVVAKLAAAMAEQATNIGCERNPSSC